MGHSLHLVNKANKSLVFSVFLHHCRGHGAASLPSDQERHAAVWRINKRERKEEGDDEGEASIACPPTHVFCCEIHRLPGLIYKDQFSISRNPQQLSEMFSGGTLLYW